MALTKIGSIGINTGIQFAGVTTIATLNASDNVLSVGGTVNFASDVSIGGTLTYEDVTNIDAIGLITARNGIVVGSGITLSKDGDIFATGISTFSEGFAGDVLIDDKIVHRGDTTTAIRFPAVGTISFECAGEEILKIGASTTELLRISGPIDASTQQEFGIGIAVNDEHTHPAAQITFKEYDASDSMGDLLFYTRGTNSDSAPTERLRIDSSGQFSLGRTSQITGNGNSSTSVFEQLSNSNYPLALHSSQTNKRGLMIFYATTGAGNAGDPFIVCTDNTNNKFQVTSDGTTTIRGNLVLATDGKGIDFSATGYGTGSSQNSLLDDYEEGNWSPSGEGFTISNTISARYTKVGRLVTVNAYVQAATGSGSSAVQITNLPFTQYGNSNYHYGSGRLGSAGGGTLSQNNIVFQAQQNLSKVKPYVNDGGINEGMISGQHIIFSVTYEAA